MKCYYNQRPQQQACLHPSLCFNLDLISSLNFLFLLFNYEKQDYISGRRNDVNIIRWPSPPLWLSLAARKEDSKTMLGSSPDISQGSFPLEPSFSSPEAPDLTRTDPNRLNSGPGKWSLATKSPQFCRWFLPNIYYCCFFCPCIIWIHVQRSRNIYI